MVESKGIVGLLRRLALYTLLAGGSFLFAIPFGWMMLSSFKTNDEQFLDPPRWLPRTPSAARVSPYIAMDEFAEIQRPRACPAARWDELRPLLLEAVDDAVDREMQAGRTIGQGLDESLRKKTMVPSFLIFKHIGWYNKLLALWVPAFCGSAFNIFLLRQFMRGIPADLEDAARIDGCSFFGVYRHVVLPCAGPALATIAIFTFMGTWNNFMGPLVFLTDQAKYPLALGIFGLQPQAGGNFGLIMAASALMALPVVVVFFFCQRYFIQGITLTGMKS